MDNTKIFQNQINDLNTEYSSISSKIGNCIMRNIYKEID